MGDYYARDGSPLETMEWTQLFGDASDSYRRVGNDQIGDVVVSTVWLGLDHRWGAGPPLIFESMVFGGEWNEYQWRYSTEAEAEAGHARIVDAVRNGKPLDWD